MCLSELIRRLKVAGAANATKDRIHRAIQEDVISRPHIDTSLRYQFEESHLEKLLVWLPTLPSYTSSQRSRTATVAK